MDLQAEMDRFQQELAAVEEGFGRRIVGNRDVLGYFLKALLAGGHVLLEGAPGLGKTLMVKTLADLLDLRFTRVQFTPDLMPADIVGTHLIVENAHGHRAFHFERGPVFTNVLLADEINRASPKTQSALLQAMEEREVTAFGDTYGLEEPFFVLATQNPIEMAGTYPLPEAQLDRFLFKLVLGPAGPEALAEIARRNLEGDPAGPVPRVLHRDRIAEIRAFVKQIPLTDPVYAAAVAVVRATHPGNPEAPDAVRTFVRFGASPRGVNALLWAARVEAVMDGRFHVALEDLEANLAPALRHRILLNYRAETEGTGPDEIVAAAWKAARRRVGA
ncbi:MAG: AAA family ATPase [Candidatus Dadabacteria bacterium]|nr:MAG: AAA family ATPase [Candidatus Dadabacteria bacterium]